MKGGAFFVQMYSEIHLLLEDIPCDRINFTWSRESILSFMVLFIEIPDSNGYYHRFSRCFRCVRMDWFVV